MLIEGIFGVKVLFGFGVAIKVAISPLPYVAFGIASAASGFPNFLEY